MAGEADEIRGYLDEQLRAGKRASLVNAIAKFDFYNHVMPSIKQMNRALSGFNVRVNRSADDIILEETDHESHELVLTGDDVNFLFESYLSAMRKKNDKTL